MFSFVPMDTLFGGFSSSSEETLTAHFLSSALQFNMIIIGCGATGANIFTSRRRPSGDESNPTVR